MREVIPTVFYCNMWLKYKQLATTCLIQRGLIVFKSMFGTIDGLFPSPRVFLELIQGSFSFSLVFVHSFGGKWRKIQRDISSYFFHCIFDGNILLNAFSCFSSITFVPLSQTFFDKIWCYRESIFFISCPHDSPSDESVFI